MSDWPNVDIWPENQGEVEARLSAELSKSKREHPLFYVAHSHPLTAGQRPTSNIESYWHEIKGVLRLVAAGCQTIAVEGFFPPGPIELPRRYYYELASLGRFYDKGDQPPGFFRATASRFRALYIGDFDAFSNLVGTEFPKQRVIDFDLNLLSTASASDVRFVSYETSDFSDEERKLRDQFVKQQLAFQVLHDPGATGYEITSGDSPNEVIFISRTNGVAGRRTSCDAKELLSCVNNKMNNEFERLPLHDRRENELLNVAADIALLGQDHYPSIKDKVIDQQLNTILVSTYGDIVFNRLAKGDQCNSHARLDKRRPNKCCIESSDSSTI